MAQYIDKSAVVAEIKRRIKEHHSGYLVCLKDILSFLNTLEVKEMQETTASDRGMAEEIIINLKRVEQDYRIDLTKEMEWLRNKVKKGEVV